MAKGRRFRSGRRLSPGRGTVGLDPAGGDLGDACVEVVDEDGVQGAAGALGVLVDEQVAVLGELPDGLGRVRDERRLATEQALVPRSRPLEIGDTTAREEIQPHGPTVSPYPQRMRSARVSRYIEAPRARVYRALLDPEALEQWMLPEEMTSRIHSFDTREGGTFRISLTYGQFTTADATTAQTDSFHGHFVTLVPDTEIVQAIEIDSDDPSMQGEMTITYTLADAGDGTELVGVHENLPPGMSPEDMQIGWTMSFDKLVRLVEHPV